MTWRFLYYQKQSVTVVLKRGGRVEKFHAARAHEFHRFIQHSSCLLGVRRVPEIEMIAC